MGASRPHLGGFQEPQGLDFEGSCGLQNSVFRSLLVLATCNFDLQALSLLKTNSASHVRLGQLLRYAFITAMTTLLHFPPLLFLLFRCGGLCAAHGIRRILLRMPRRVKQLGAPAVLAVLLA